jgi:PLP dependent protein
MSNIVDKISRIENQIEGKAKLIAVSKKQPESKLLEAYNAGFKRFGENYVQELVSKAENLPKDIEWHMIGHLQTNKVKSIAPFVSLIHSVDSLKLLKEINKQAVKNNRIIDILLQVHIAQEDSKTGLDAEGLYEILNSDLSTYQNVRIVGLMGMSTFTDNMAIVKAEFSELSAIYLDIKKRFVNLPITELSMGMSGDWKLAVENGSTLIRVGSSIFGNRIL